MMNSELFHSASAKQFFTLILIGAVLFLSFFFARGSSIILAFALVALIAVVILYKQPALGLIGLIPAALIIPYGYSTGTLTDINIAAIGTAGLLGVWILRMAQARKFEMHSSAPIAPLLALCGATLFSFLMGIQPLYPFAKTAPVPAQVGGLAIFLLSASIFLVVVHLVTEQRWLEYMVWVFLAMGVLYIGGRLIPQLSDSILDLYVDSAQGATGSLFWVWLVALAFSQALFNNRLKDFVRLGLVAFCMATLYVGYFLGRWWVSGYLPGFVAIFALIGLKSWRLGLVAAVIAGLYLLVFNPDFINSLVGLKGYSIDTRADASQILLFQIFPINPIFGLGPANYYWYTPLFPIRGYYVQFNSHNQYTDLLLQTGIVGTAFYAWFIIAIGLLGWKLRNRVPEGFARAYVYGGLGGLAGMLMAGAQGDWVLPFVYNIGLGGFRASMFGWMFLGGLVALEWIYRETDTSEESSAPALLVTE